MQPLPAARLVLTRQVRTAQHLHPAVVMEAELALLTDDSVERLRAAVEAEFEAVGRVTTIAMGRSDAATEAAFAAAPGRIFHGIGPADISPEFEESFASERSIPRRIVVIQLWRTTLPGLETTIQVAALATTDPRRWDLQIDRGEDTAPLLARSSRVEAHTWASVHEGDTVRLHHLSADGERRILATWHCLQGPLWDDPENHLTHDGSALAPPPTESAGGATDLHITEAIEHLEYRVAALRAGVAIEGERRPEVGHPIFSGLWQAVSAIQTLQETRPDHQITKSLVMEQIARSFGTAAHLNDRGQPAGGWWRGPSDDVVTDIERISRDQSTEPGAWQEAVPIRLAQVAVHHLGLGMPNGFRLWYLYAALAGEAGLAQLPRDDKGINVTAALVTVATAFRDHGIRVRPCRYGDNPGDHASPSEPNSSNEGSNDV